jgi:leucyl-tRNA synthetase
VDFAVSRMIRLLCSPLGHTRFAQRGAYHLRRWSSTTKTVQLDDKWREKWKQNPPRPTTPSKEKYFALSMFPYPSGVLHIGHLRVYTISDVLARYRRMNGYDVVHAMGWDAFGLPAENAALERNIDPGVWTYTNISKMRQQMDKMLADFDWEREVITCSPEYYKWTQKLFLMLHEAGLAYRKEAEVNWDPIEKTVLANEQVDAEGRSWRSGAVVEKKRLEQWFLGITKLAPELLDDLTLLENWPNKVKAMQKNWIGRSEGAKIRFPVDGHQVKYLETFTTRPDTLYGLGYVAVALDHDLTRELSKEDDNLAEFVKAARGFSEDSKRGFKVPNVYVANPLTPDKYDVPVFVAPYVISDYGHGAVMGCPAHDTRDAAFWNENAPGSPAVCVIKPPAHVKLEPGEIYTDKQGTLNEKCQEFEGLTSAEGGRAIVKKIQKYNLGEPSIQMKLRDWLISRQRFWGAPIPMIHCDDCGIVPVPDRDLPVVLPEQLGSPLATSEEFLETSCPSCGGPARRDSDTMDTFMDSAWYFFRYTDPKNETKIFDYHKASSLMPVDIYVGGVEHAILHLLYARFISKFLKQAGSWSGGDLNAEPVRKLVTQGMVHGKTFVDPETGRFLNPDEVDVSDPEKPYIISNGKFADIRYEKMSKSKYNGADPVQCIESHGADATRAHILFQAPVSDVLNWDESKIVGIERWLARVHQLTDMACGRGQPVGDVNISDLVAEELDVWSEVQKKISQVSVAFHHDLTLNTVISDYMKLTRTIMSASSSVRDTVFVRSVEILLKLIAPVTPVNAEECWEMLLKARGEVWTTIFAEKWPQQVLKPDDISRYAVIINGKRRLVLLSPPNTTDDRLLELVKNDPEGRKWLDGKTINRTIVGKKAISIMVD